ncbi:hypothetical protein BB561_000441 [Smittium simulii]|uniref:BAP29/BAP31 transmembrane domain-containing protein n=1 Tax=Smittium simulii TaxID=133385 RepID=A0A2T9YZ43_9FUNG|nr:hypothetical protein BB561_000441 [Smittium simulii]
MSGVTYSVIFAVMISEILVFIVLVFPFPNKWKRAAVKAIGTSKLLNSIIKVLKYKKLADASILTADAKTYSSLTISKIYEQRNMYLTGITLILRFTISSAFSTIKKTMHAQIELERLIKKQSVEMVSNNTSSSKVENKIKKLEDQIIESEEKLLESKKKQIDYINLNKQAENAYQVLMDLSEKHQTLLVSLGLNTENKKDS